MIGLFNNEILNKVLLTSENRWKNGMVGSFSFEKMTPQRPFLCRFHDSRKKEEILLQLEKNEKEIILGGISVTIEENKAEIIKDNEVGLGFIPCLLFTRNWPEIKDIDNLYVFYYNLVKKYTIYSSKEDLLKKENEYYLFTKKRLLPFLGDIAWNDVINYTRNFFEYAQEKGCIGVFIEDEPYKIDERLVKVDKILSAYKYNSMIDDYNIKLIKNAIYHFVHDNRIEISLGIAKLCKNAKSDFTYYLMTSCFYAIYSENYNTSDREKWCRLCGALFDKQQKTWQSHWNDRSNISREFMRKIESFYK